MDFTLDLGGLESAPSVEQPRRLRPHPTALSLTWGLDEYADLLFEASKKI